MVQDRKHVILYASKQGTAQSCAEYLNRQYSNTIIYDVSRDSVPSLSADDDIIIITGIYLGKMNHSMRKFIHSHTLELSNRDINMVVCAGAESEFFDAINKEFQSIDGVVLHTHYAGFKYNFARLNFIEKFMIKRIAGARDLEDHVKYQALDDIMVDTD